MIRVVVCVPPLFYQSLPVSTEIAILLAIKEQCITSLWSDPDTSIVSESRPQFMELKVDVFVAPDDLDPSLTPGRIHQFTMDLHHILASILEKLPSTVPLVHPIVTVMQLSALTRQG